MDAEAISALQIMERKIDELPLLPQVLVRILQLDPDMANYFEEFGKLTKEDPAFAVRVIALANSSASAPVVPVVSIREALARMGVGTIRNLVASLAVQRVFLPTKPNEISLWQHSVFTAFAAAKIAEIVPSLDVNPAESYLVGLLHDVGRFVMFEHAAPELLAVDESQWKTPEELIEADVDVYMFTHSELGYLACVHWNLPETICDAIRMHHTPIEGRILPSSPEAQQFCLQAADRLALALLQRDDFEEVPEDVRSQRIEENCLVTEDSRTILPPAQLVMHLDSVYAEGRDLLAGLGFD
ncbi:MAG: HDOD domain-containing protein [Woeseiaceae bacterium]|nr:HDOD domain-containing protein [Woeseiaceae bacterium]